MALQTVSPAADQLISSLVYVLVIPVYMFAMRGQFSSMTISGSAWAAGGAICATIAAFTFMYLAKTQDIGTLTVYTGVYPIITIILSMMFLGEGITLRKTIGMICGIATVMILG
jgi:drug/metabolite transporter (DMT)-like permease